MPPKVYSYHGIPGVGLAWLDGLALGVGLQEVSRHVYEYRPSPKDLARH